MMLDHGWIHIVRMYSFSKSERSRVQGDDGVGSGCNLFKYKRPAVANVASLGRIGRASRVGFGAW